jgi:hypothetical protein
LFEACFCLYLALLVDITCESQCFSKEAS